MAPRPLRLQSDSAPHPTVATGESATQPRSDAYRRDRAAALKAAGGIFAMCCIGALGFAHGKLWDHDRDLRELQVRVGATKEALDSVGQKLDRLLERLVKVPQ